MLTPEPQFIHFIGVIGMTVSSGQSAFAGKAVISTGEEATIMTQHCTAEGIKEL